MNKSLIEPTSTKHFTYQILLMVFIFAMYFCWVNNSQADMNECSTCVERKALSCTGECAKVKPDLARKCQQNCIRDNCTHRCSENAPEIEDFFAKDCNRCLEQQFGLCEELCKIGTPRKKAVCQIDCSEQHCATLCNKP